MKICFSFFLILFCSVHYLYSQDSVNIKNCRIGEDTLNIRLSLTYPYSSSVSFINLHDDENTSVDAGGDFLSKYGGSLLQLQHTGKRNFTFTLMGQSFSFDPNRIFTDEGLKATLEKHSIYREDAAIAVKFFADSLLKNFIDHKKLVVALHNNTEHGLSILSYKKGGYEENNAANIYINPSLSPHDFILTTNESFFYYIKQKRFNVVLQNDKPSDDGSLSVYANKKNIPYINVEALQGHLNEQIRMLEALKDIIYRY